MSQDKDNKYTHEIIVQMLKDYRVLQRRAKQLEFEITNYAPAATDEDMIDAMTFNSSLGDGGNSIHTGQASDKTANIAVSYAEKVDKLNRKHKQELESDLRAVNTEMLRLETYISLLDEKQSKTLRMLYLEGLTFVKAADRMNLSVDTVKNYRKAGIKCLVEMYNNILK